MAATLRLRIFAAHLAISAAVIGACIAFIVIVWYPPPLAQLEGLFSILLVMAGVDMCAGPLCTLVAASPKKPRRELVRDLAIIGSVQLAALGYALYTTCVARPAFIVYSAGGFEVEHANELSRQELAKAGNPAFSTRPLTGPVFVEARFPDDPREAAKIVNSALLTGVDIKDMPQYFEAWPYAKTDAREKGTPVAALASDRPLRRDVARILAHRGVPAADAVVLPISGKVDRGTVVLRKSDLAVLGIVPHLAPPVRPEPPASQIAAGQGNKAAETGGN